MGIELCAQNRLNILSSTTNIVGHAYANVKEKDKMEASMERQY